MRYWSTVKSTKSHTLILTATASGNWSSCVTKRIEQGQRDVDSNSAACCKHFDIRKDGRAVDEEESEKLRQGKNDSVWLPNTSRVTGRRCRLSVCPAWAKGKLAHCTMCHSAFNQQHSKLFLEGSTIVTWACFFHCYKYLSMLSAMDGCTMEPTMFFSFFLEIPVTFAFLPTLSSHFSFSHPLYHSFKELSLFIR